MSSPDTTRLTDPRPRPPRPDLLPSRRTAVLLALGALGIAFLSFWYNYVDVLVRGRPEPFQIKLIEEVTGAFGAVLLLVPVVWLTRYLRWSNVPAHVQAILHVPAVAAFAGLHTTLLWASRTLLFPLAGLGPYDYGDIPLRYAMELGIQIPIYLLIVGGTVAVDHVRASRAKDLRLARLEAELARARLDNLAHQLRPHFLFNALNTVSSLMYEDRDRADRILADLARFLQRSLRSHDAQEVALGEELDDLELFLGVARARFEDRLDVNVDAEPTTLRAAVPALLLQPLVENALHHGDPGEDRQAVIRVAAAVRDGMLVLRVADNGPGAGAPFDELADRGIGLGNTRRRLDLLHPGTHVFRGGDRPDGGFEVEIAIPYRPAPAAPADSPAAPGPSLAGVARADA